MNILTSFFYRIIRIFTLAICPLIAGSFAFGQTDPAADSLLRKLKIPGTNDTAKVKLLNNLSGIYIGTDYKLAIHYGEMALKLAEKSSFPVGIGIAKNKLALSYYALGEAQTAIKFALGAEEIGERYGLPEITAESCRIIGSAYLDQGDLKRGEIFYAKAEKFALQTSNSKLLARIINGSGTVQMRKKNDKIALNLFNKSLSLANQSGLEFYKPLILSNIGEIYGRPALKNLELELKFYKESLFYARQAGNKMAEANALNNLGKALIGIDHFGESEHYLKKALALSSSLGSKIIASKVYLNLVELNLKQGRFPQVQQYISRFYDIRDTLVNATRAKQIAELEARFETEKKEQQIRILEQEKQLQITRNNFWILGSALLSIALIIIYLLQKSRSRKSRQLLDIQDTLIEKLKETDLLKSRFFANISHEFRTPLSLILSPVEKMLNSPESAEQKDLLLVQRNANRLLELVNELLDLSKLEAGKMNLRVRKGNLREWLHVLAGSFDSLADVRSIRFLKIISITPEHVWFDQDKLEKILTNILFNAFKFTGPGGSITFSTDLNTEGTELLIRLSDTGRGIPDEDIPHVFSPFYQSGNLMEDGQPGTGLGLTLVSELVKTYRGQIELTSKLNLGTTIHIVLPVGQHKFGPEEFVDLETITQKTALPIAPDVHVSDTNAEAAGCLLIVEDSVELRNFIADIFKNQFKVVTAMDGEEGLKLAIDLMPDLIISDVMMPKMDGIRMLEEIRKNPVTDHIPVILLTAKSDVSSRIDGLRRGADDYLAKPFSNDELRTRVTNLIDSRKKLADKYRNATIDSPAPHLASSDEKFVASLRAVVEAHLADSSFSVEQLAETMCLSRTQLFRKVKALLDLSPNELINDIRLQHAAERIRSKSDTLTQISYSVGFSEQSYFAKRFRKKFGVSPKEYGNS